MKKRMEGPAGRWGKAARSLCLCGLILTILAGCGMQETLSSGNRTEKEYGEPETMVIVSSERLRYEELYTEQIWNAAVDNRGTTFETVLIGQIHDFMRELKAMSLMAEEENIRLTSRERDLVKEAARKYYETLGGTDAARFGIDEKALEAFYTDYWTAQKLADQLTAGMDLEVSDSEAKVITVWQVVLSDPAQAGEVLALAQEEGADFGALAKEYSEDTEIEKQIPRGVRSAELEDAAFALAEGEISDVVLEDGSYYILKCVDDYDEAATRERKKQMVLQKKNEAFFERFAAFRGSLSLAEDTAFWESLTISGGPEVTADFFGIFESVCLEE